MDSNLSLYSSNLKQNVKVVVQRPAFTQVRFDEGYQVLVPKTSTFLDELKKLALRYFHCDKDSSNRAKDFLFRTFPSVKWLSKYNLRQNFLADFVTGCIIACIHVPQGMGYALLIGLPPIYGVYVALFPLFMYALLGTSRHISIGNSVVVTVSVAQAVHSFSLRMVSDSSLQKYKATEFDNFQNETLYKYNSSSSFNTDMPLATIVTVSCTVTFLAGILQMFMGFLHFGFLTIYLSDPLVSGYTTGAALHVVVTQLKNFVNIKIPKFYGPAKMFFTIFEVFKKWYQTNVTDLFIAVLAVIILILFKIKINPKLMQKWKILIPIEILVVVLGTAVSYFGNLSAEYKIQVVGYIPKGLPPFRFPEINLFSRLISNSLIVAVVSFCVTLSMSKMFAKKHNYPIDANQEFVSIGVANIFGSLFGCYAAGASMSRSSTQDSTGGKTQMCSFVACGIVLIVLLVLSTLFEHLPSSILAAIIVVSLKGILSQFKDLKRLWHISKVDFAIWFVTFLSVIILDIDYGLAMGVGFSFFTVVIRTQRPRWCVLGRVPRTDIYKDMTKYPVAEEIPGLKIFLFEASLYFANCEYFKSVLYSQTVNPRILKTQMEEYYKYKESIHNSQKKLKSCGLCYCVKMCASEQNVAFEDNLPLTDIHHIIIDCSTFSYIDSAGVDTLIQINEDYQSVGIILFFAHCKAMVSKMLHTSGFFDQVPEENLFLTVHDAVLHAVHTNLKIAFSCDLLVTGSRLLDTDSCCSSTGFVLKQDDGCNVEETRTTLENMRNEIEKMERQKLIQDPQLETPC